MFIAYPYILKVKQFIIIMEWESNEMIFTIRFNEEKESNKSFQLSIEIV